MSSRKRPGKTGRLLPDRECKSRNELRAAYFNPFLKNSFRTNLPSPSQQRCGPINTCSQTRDKAFPHQICFALCSWIGRFSEIIGESIVRSVTQLENSSGRADLE